MTGDTMDDITKNAVEQARIALITEGDPRPQAPELMVNEWKALEDYARSEANVCEANARCARQEPNGTAEAQRHEEAGQFWREKAVAYYRAAELEDKFQQAWEEINPAELPEHSKTVMVKERHVRFIEASNGKS